uniref:G_PROTEIN_RECEP_F1_2 domain-containing protein n=1 Tax=Strongyloides papillosus TaxID=174720 RepID=A0A0N5C447_STREA
MNSSSETSGILYNLFNSTVIPNVSSQTSIYQNFDKSFEDDCSELITECTCHIVYSFYEYPEIILLGVVAFPLIIFGIINNILSILIFTHELMKTSSINWYLTIISLSDTIILISAFFVLTLPRLGEFIELWGAVSLRQVYFLAPYMYGMMTMAQTISVWMTTGVSLHRYAGVCFPFESISLLRPKKVRTFIGSILIFSIVFNSSRFFEVNVVNDCYRTNIEYSIPVIMPTLLRINEAYRTIFFGWAYTIVMFIIPFIVLIFVNTAVVSVIHKSNRLHLTQGSDSMTFKKSETKERQTTIMLVAIVIVFLACNVLAFVVNIMENLNLMGSLYNTLVWFNNLLVLVNASCNFLIYLIFSDKYRALLLYFISGKCLIQERTLVLAEVV